MAYMVYLIVGGTRSYCSCDSRSSVDPGASGHYQNYAPDYHKSKHPCGKEWEYYVTTYFPQEEYKQAVVPWRK